MAWNQRSRAAVDETGPDARPRVMEPDGVVDEPVDGRDTVIDGRDGVDHGDVAAERDAERAAADRDETERQPFIDPNAREAGDGAVVTEPVSAPVAPRVRARGSLVTTIGLIVGVVALCAALTGLLAPEGLVLGIVGVLVSMGGLRAARRDGVTGSATAVLSVLIGLITVVVAVMAMTGDFSWPNSRTDQIQVWHDWLAAHWSTLNRW